MSCGHCEHAVRTEVAKVAGVDSVTVDLGTKDVVVHGADLVTADLVGAVVEAGYDVNVTDCRRTRSRGQAPELEPRPGRRGTALGPDRRPSR